MADPERSEDELRRLLSSSSVPATAPTLDEVVRHGRRRRDRHRVLVGLGVAVVVLVLAGVAGAISRSSDDPGTQLRFADVPPSTTATTTPGTTGETVAPSADPGGTTESTQAERPPPVAGGPSDGNGPSAPGETSEPVTSSEPGGGARPPGETATTTTADVRPEAVLTLESSTDGLGTIAFVTLSTGPAKLVGVGPELQDERLVVRQCRHLPGGSVACDDAPIVDAPLRALNLVNVPHTGGTIRSSAFFRVRDAVAGSPCGTDDCYVEAVSAIGNLTIPLSFRPDRSPPTLVVDAVVPRSDGRHDVSVRVDGVWSRTWNEVLAVCEPADGVVVCQPLDELYRTPDGATTVAVPGDGDRAPVPPPAWNDADLTLDASVVVGAPVCADGGCELRLMGRPLSGFGSLCDLGIPAVPWNPAVG